MGQLRGRPKCWRVKGARVMPCGEPLTSTGQRRVSYRTVSILQCQLHLSLFTSVFRLRCLADRCTLRVRILWIIKVPKIPEFLRILKLSILLLQWDDRSCQHWLRIRDKFFVANTAALNTTFGLKILRCQQCNIR